MNSVRYFRVRYLLEVRGFFFFLFLRFGFGFNSISVVESIEVEVVVVLVFGKAEEVKVVGGFRGEG